MNEMEITCTCGEVHHIRPEDFGKTIICNKCGDQIQVPAVGRPPEPARESAGAGDPSGFTPPGEPSHSAGPASEMYDRSRPLGGEESCLAPIYIPPAQPTRTSGLAITSFILGFSFFFTCGIGSIVGIILGFLALAEMKKDPSVQGGGLAKIGIAVSFAFIGLFIIGLMLSIIMPSIIGAGNAARQANAENSLRLIGTAALQYKLENGAYPDSLQELAKDELISSDLASGNSGGFTFYYKVFDYGFECYAIPYSRTGKSLYIDQDGEVRYSSQREPLGGENWRPLY